MKCYAAFYDICDDSTLNKECCRDAVKVTCKRCRYLLYITDGDSYENEWRLEDIKLETQNILNEE